jgi:hypothetical protein
MTPKLSLAVLPGLALLVTAALASPSPPAIQFTSVPPFGSSLNLSGTALNVNPSNFRVAVYIFVDGWYNKPTSAAPLTSIQANGSWTCDITTGGNDPQATRIAAFLLPSTNQPPIVNGTNALPAQLDQLSVARLIINRYATEINFSGYKWEVKNSGANLVGPGTNYFSSATSNVWVDVQGRLHLRITKQTVNGTNQWHCAEVVSQLCFGNGTYRISLDSRVDNLDPNVVHGFFTWSDDPTFNHREMDIEFSKFGNATDRNNAQYVVQPFTVAGNRVRFQVPAGLAPSTHSFKWETNRISYLSLRDYYFAGPTTNSFNSWNFTDASKIPPARDENVRLNLWLFNGIPPVNGQEWEIIINRFAFVPLQINPPTLVSSPYLTNGQYRFQLKGQPQISYYLQGGTDLTSNSWSFLSLLSSPDGVSTFVETNAAGFGRRFYQALVPPQ